MRYNLLIIALTIFLLNCKEQEAKAYDLIIRNGQVIDIVSGEINEQDLYIRDGIIVEIDTSRSGKNLNAKHILDASDKFVLPGFWDNHVHFRGGESLIEDNKRFLELYIKNGITTIRDAGGDLTTSVLRWRKEMEQGELVGPTIYTSGPKIDGPDARWAGSLSVDSDSEILIALDSLQMIKTDFVKLYDSTISGAMYLNTISEAENRNMITSGHMPFTVELQSALHAGLDAVEHLYYVLKGCSSEEEAITRAIINKELTFWKSMEQLMSTYNEDVARATFDELKNRNVYVVPTLHIGNVLSYLDEVDHQNDEYLKFMGDGIIKTYEGRIKGALNATEKSRKDRKKLNSFFRKLAKTLSDADVKLLAGSDSGAFNSYTYPGISLHNELEALVDVGIAPLKALQTSAYNGAYFLKKNDVVGTIEVGKKSDLVILNSNPLQDIRNTKDIDKVVKGIAVIQPSEL